MNYELIPDKKDDQIFGSFIDELLHDSLAGVMVFRSEIQVQRKSFICLNLIL